MKVSVIVPNYRHAPYLRERIESILTQTYQDFELILLDDCSPDNSREILESYKDHPKVSHLICNTENSGSTFRQWEKGFNLAQGKYIWIAESDDFAAPAFLEKCVEQLEKSPDCVIAYTESQIVDSNSKPFSKKFKSAQSSKMECDLWQGKEFVIRNMLIHNSIYNASMVVFRKSAIPTRNQYTQFRLNGDWLFWCEICLQGMVAHINLKLNSFRQHEAKVTVEQTRTGGALIELSSLYNILFQRLQFPPYLRWAIEGRIGKHIRKKARELKKEQRKQICQRWDSHHPHSFIKRYWYLFYKLFRIKPRIK